MQEEAVLCQPQMVAIVAVTAVLFPPTACERIMVIQLQVGAARTRRLSLVSYQTLFHWTDFWNTWTRQRKSLCVVLLYVRNIDKVFFFFLF